VEYKLDSEIEAIIVCPQCHQKIDVQALHLKCSGCKSEYKISKSGQPDLRLVKEKEYTLKIDLGHSLNVNSDVFEVLTVNPKVNVDLKNFVVPFHLSKELVSYFPIGNNGIALDLGSGTGLHKELCIQCGFKYVGLDYNSEYANIKGDAHSLPFKDNSIDFIISIAVLEHVQHPYIMMTEAFRVLKPGGKFIGTVSYLEPFHGVSYYNHTHMGVFNSLSVAGFNVINISPMPDWQVLNSVSQMALFPRLPKIFISVLYKPLQFIHRLWWKIGYLVKKSEMSAEKTRLFLTSGSFSFIASKEQKTK
jgi:ubiquinone/menaquinone biosynthesis C-methylase UbiE